MSIRRQKTSRNLKRLGRVFSTTYEFIFRILSKDRKISSFFSNSSALFAENNQGVPLFCCHETRMVFKNENCFDTFAPLTPVFATFTQITRVGVPLARHSPLVTRHFLS